ncbi:MULTISPECIES: RagB/SusD family nutrient uptake outer membrane protein [Reichenbachiella]|uniref:Starch-binding associating with outer membrane n=1 Tax=Reichenbachiella agariperforans TaxID=156994 RepID=A0A1M6V3J7_REIAG|nr:MULTISPECIES: RagB/SusD family nutrient uptake outer membrane protein [Reichenbachiella]RJE72753.1 carbohydrate-binding protein SusD [Reichenbachiella sp. MSK19-1]SHK75886.1 Starch-binding associating with outer membrane [Reichenbachiella agariperforans]
MKNIFSIITLALIFLVGCESFLEEENKSNVTAEEFYLTEEGYESLINASYSSMRSLYGQDPWMFASGTDLYTDGRNQSPVGLAGYTQLNGAAEGVDFIYLKAYVAVQRANTALHYATLTAPTDNLDQYVGEMKFIRANAYFLLVQSYGGVALITELVDEAVTEFDRAEASAVYDLIIQDLEEALITVSKDGFAGRVTERAVQDMLAKVHLTRAYEDFAASDDFSKAASYADAAIGSQTLNLSFEELWTPGNEMNEEVIFSVQFDAASISTAPTELGNQQQNFFGSYTGGTEVAGDAPYKSYNLCPTRFALDLFEQGDERWEATFMTEVYARYFDYFDVADHSTLDVVHFYAPAWYTTVDSTAYVSALSTDELANFRYHKYGTYDPEGGDISGNYATIIVKKFDDPTSRFASAGNDAYTSTRDVVVSRLAETYLVAAEAYLGANNEPTALDRINEVRSRANVADMTALDLDDILDERGRELMGEYKRWFDLKRTGKLVERASAHNPQVETTNFTGNNSTQKILRPIPQSALDLNQNPDYKQNPAYSK